MCLKYSRQLVFPVWLKMKSACRGFNQLSTTRVAGWGLVGWPGELVPKKAVFRPELCWLIFWTFISHLELFMSQLEHFISHLELLYPAKSTFISLLVHGPCKELCSPAIFFLKSATKRLPQHKKLCRLFFYKRKFYEVVSKFTKYTKSQLLINICILHYKHGFIIPLTWIIKPI